MRVNAELLAFLGEFVSPNKREKIQRVLDQRTRHIAIALEDIYQPHNASACLRSCDCLGVQDVHIVENRNEYQPTNEVAMGAEKWLTLHRYRRIDSCLETLRSSGYRIVATTPNEQAHDLLSLPLDRPVALLFGTEEQGLTAPALDAADTTLRLPMYGFTRSYNISVTVAITLSRLVERLRDEGHAWQLAETDREDITLDFYRAIVTRHDLLEVEFWNRR